MNVRKEFIAIIKIIEQARLNAYTAVNIELVNCYWQVGGFISSRIANASWGDKAIDQLADYIQNEYPGLKGYNRRGLYRMKQFYETYANSPFVSPAVTQMETTKTKQSKIVTPLVTQLTSDIRQSMLCKIGWTHHLVILSGTKTPAEKEFYINLCIRERYGKRELERQISSGLFERVVIGKQSLPPGKNHLQQDIANSFKDNYVFEFLNLPEEHSEGICKRLCLHSLKPSYLNWVRIFYLLVKNTGYRLETAISISTSYFIIVPFVVWLRLS